MCNLYQTVPKDSIALYFRALIWDGFEPGKPVCPFGASLSGILCAGHSVTKRSMYANHQEHDEGGVGRCGGDAVDTQASH
jgi:hypothetical protein